MEYGIKFIFRSSSKVAHHEIHMKCLVIMSYLHRGFCIWHFIKPHKNILQSMNTVQHKDIILIHRSASASAQQVFKLSPIKSYSCNQ